MPMNCTFTAMHHIYKINVEQTFWKQKKGRGYRILVSVLYEPTPEKRKKRDENLTS